MSVYEALLALVGEPPPGYEIVVWFCAVIVCIYLICSVFSIIASIIGWVGGR